MWRSPDGKTVAFIRTSGQRMKPCKYCGAPGEKLCDYPLRGPKAGQTCDAPMCAKCAYHVPPNSDYCRLHRKMLTPDGRLKL
jgi:hypothetical protein